MAIALTILLTSTTAFAQYHPRPLPTVPAPPGSHRYDPPDTIIIPSNPTGGTQETTVVDLNTGTITIIQQTGNETFILRP
jgi:tRNA A37 threonylcarbamoyladenosine synthetase subunit TsaC/SUA5/YrdC